MCGRLEAKLQQLMERYYNLLGRGFPEAADMAEEEMMKYRELLDCAVRGREHHVQCQQSLGTQFLRDMKKPPEK